MCDITVSIVYTCTMDEGMGVLGGSGWGGGENGVADLGTFDGSLDRCLCVRRWLNQW